MRYVLIIGFFCKIYKKQPRIRLFMNNQLIDEFDVQNNESIYQNDEIFHRLLDQKNNLKPNIAYWQNYFKEFPHLHLFEIEIKEKSLKIQIDILNDDNNYQNGFMTKNTLLQLRSFYFLPMEKKVLQTFSELLLKRKLRRLAWFFRTNNREFIDVFDLANLTKWFSKKNSEVIESNEHQQILNFTIGGSGYFEIELKKKYGILLPIVPYQFMYCKKSTIHFINNVCQYVY